MIDAKHRHPPLLSIMRAYLLPLLGASIAFSSGLPTPDELRVKNVPGLDPSFSQEMFAGQIPLGINTRRIYFYFIRARNDSPKTPIAFWYTGGPGCSSLAAMMTEQGPFWPNENGTVSENDNAWTNQMNMVFVDSPAGVGFSEAPERYAPNDSQTAEDAYDFTKRFMEVFPDMNTRDMYLTGESYAGHYVPNLAVRMLLGNEDIKKSGSTKGLLNLRGFMVGNPWTSATIDNRAAVDFWADHGLVLEEDAARAHQICNYDNIGPLAVRNIGNASKGAFGAAYGASCNELVNRMMDSFDNINIYDIYADTCDGKGPIPPMFKSFQPSGKHGAAARAAQPRAPVSAAHALRRALFGPEDQPPTSPCINYWASDWLNEPAVQKAINAPKREWHTCDFAINGAYSHRDVMASVIPQYEYILQYMKQDLGFKFLVFAGDTDAIVPFTGTRRWVQAIGNTTIATRYVPWLANGQVGGFVRSYNNDGRFVFTTVRGAGHMVPSTQPFRGAEMIRRFLDGTLAKGGK